MQVDAAFWAGKKVLITGHTGFKGSWLTLWLLSLGAEPVGFARRAPTHPALFELARLGDAVPWVTGDVRDHEGLRRAVARHRPDIVFHLAAQPLVRRGFAEPLETYAANVMGTVHLLEAVRREPGVRAVVCVTTDKVYENQGWEWGYREYEAKGGPDPYGSSKACSELVTDAYRRSFFAAGPALGSARAGNVIGGGDWAEDRLVPDLIRAGLDGGTVRIRSPDAVRPWQHVLNPLSGYLLLAQGLWESHSYADGWNFGPEDVDARPVRWIAERVAEMWGGALHWELDGGSQPQEALYLKLDSSKARHRLGWTGGWGLEEGLRRTVEWFAAYRDGQDVRAHTLAQIDAFAAALAGSH